MIRAPLVAVGLLLPLAARAQTDQQTLVDRATLTIQEMLAGQDNQAARDLIKRARGVMVCPQVFKAGFILGGQGGDCVLLGARRPARVSSSATASARAACR
jgi:SH3 domain-containing YSC84-like protein 1